jgi:hypothetical protein
MIPIARKRKFVFAASLCALAWVAIGLFHSTAAQSSASGSNTPQAQAPAASSSDKPANKASEKPAEPATQSAPAKKPRVITTEDFKSGRYAGTGGRDRDIPGVGECDDECADQARELTEFGPDQDGDWAIALTTARRNLAQDPAWPAAIATLRQAVRTYCTYQSQLQATAVPSGDDYNSRVERARIEQAAADTERALANNVNNANARIDQMAGRVDEDEPARAAIMRVLAQRVNDSCVP